MRTLLTGISILIGGMLLLSCGDDTSKSDHHEDNNHSSDHSAIAENELRLNEGHKWMMDDHTRSSFNKMAGSFLNMDHLSLEGEGLKKAGSDLQIQIDELIKGCTMTGKAHDQLHVYLMGYIPAVKELKESGRIEDAKKVRHYLEIYDEYFE